MGTLLAGRAVQGIGGGGLISISQTLIADAVAPKERGKYVAYISAMWLAASVSGPMLGGLAAGAGAWRSIFWINVPLAVAALALARSALASAPRDLNPRPIDMLGTALSAMAITAFLLAVTWIGEEEIACVLGSAVAALALGVAFLRHAAAAPEPLIPASMLRLSIVRIGASTSFLAFASHVGLATSAPFFLIERGLSPATAGFSLMALLVGAVAGANTAGRLMARSPRYHRYGVLGLAAACAGSLWLGLRCGQASLFEIEGALFLAGLGAGAQNPITAIAAQNAVDSRDLGVVTAFFAVARSLGGAFGASAFTAVVALLSPDSPTTMADGATRHASAFFVAAACYALAALLLTRMENRPLREA
jgi:MFS family permease